MYPDDVQRLYRWAGSGCRCRLRQEAAAEGVLTQRGPSQAAGVLDADSPAVCVCQLHRPLCTSTYLSESCKSSTTRWMSAEVGCSTPSASVLLLGARLITACQTSRSWVSLHACKPHMQIIREPWKHSDATPYVLASLGHASKDRHAQCIRLHNPLYCSNVGMCSWWDKQHPLHRPPLCMLMNFAAASAGTQPQ